MILSDYINPTKLVDTPIFPRSSQSVWLKNYAPLIAMTPLGQWGHMAIATISTYESFSRRNMGRTCLLIAYIGGMTFNPIATSIAAQCFAIYNNKNKFFSVQHGLNNLATISSIATILSANPHVRVTAVALRTINFLNEARISSDSIKKCAVAFIGAVLCAADLYEHEKDVMNTAEAVKNFVTSSNTMSNFTSNNSNFQGDF